MKSHWPYWLDYLLLSIVLIVFFAICRCGFFMGDDIAMGYGVFSSIKDVLSHTKWFYLNLGGRYFSVASQFFFSGLIGQKIWFDIVNTLFFALLILACGILIGSKKHYWFHYTLLFALLFWFLCPAPSESMFWMAGATTHLWANALAFTFLCLFIRYKDEDSSFFGKIALLCISFISAAEFITCAAICGALATYYTFHIKSLKKNAFPLVVGFVFGSMVVLFAPGNFLRATEELTPFPDRISYLVTHPIQEIIKYKALWLFLIIILWGWIKNSMAIKAWIKSNVILILSLGWSIIAFSVVFRPANRALFFPESLSLVLLLRLLFDNYTDYKSHNNNERINQRLALVRALAFFLLLVAFMLDSGFAIAETRKQRTNNDVLLKKVADSGGIIALDRVVSSHRMAYTTSFPQWVEEPLAERFGLDSVHVYPHFCQDKFYHLGPPLENAFIEDNYAEDDIFGREARLTIRVKEDDVFKAGDTVSFQISYSRPRKWYKAWFDKWRDYQYDRVANVERDCPDAVYNGYCFYVFWMKKENLRNLTGIIIGLEHSNNTFERIPSPSI